MSASRGQFEPEFSELPDQIPMFNFPKGVLLPAAGLTLGMNRPSYVSLVLDALTHPCRLIGLIQTRDKDEGGEPGEFYEIGGAGRITSFAETENERNVITLTLFGTSRFRLLECYDHEAGYRLGRVSWDEFRSDLTPAEAEIDRNYLIDMMQQYFDLNGYQAENWDRFVNYGNERLVAVMSTLCPFEASEKQALLESPDLESRAKLLAAILEMACYHKNDEQSTKH